MAKLFKTISLEERLKNSSYNNLPAIPKEINQGSFVPKEKAKNYTSAQETLLRKIPKVIQEGSIMLKKLISIADIKNVIPAINTQQAIIPPTTPFLNTNFRSAISLANRLKQVTLGTTYGLGTYFLSDTYTNFLKIEPSTFNSLLLQGTFFSNGVYFSRTVIKNPIAIGDVNQGYIFQLDTPATQTEIAGSQGGIGLLNKPTSLFTLSLLQGLIFSNGQTVSNITPLDSKAEGTLTTNPYTDIRRPAELDSTRTPSDQNLRYPTDPFWSEKLKTNIKIINSIAAPSQGNVTPRNGPYKATGLRTITFKPNRDGAILNTAVKFLNDYLSLNTPTLIHGNGPNDYPNYSDAVKNLQGNWLFNRANAQDFDYGTSPATRFELSAAYKKGQVPGGVIVSYPRGNLDNLKDYISKLKPTNESLPPVWIWDQVGVSPQSFLGKTTGIITILSDSDGFSDQALIDRAETPGGGFDDTNVEKARVHIPKKVVGSIENNSLSDYATLSYTQIIAKAKSTEADGNYTKDNPQGDFRVKDTDISKRSTPYSKTTDPTTDRPNIKNPNTTNNSISTYTIRDYNKESIAATKDNRQPTKRNPAEKIGDRLPIKIVGKSSVTFSAYLTAFSDSFGINWNDLSYVGRQDTLKTFKGVTRSGNLAFKVVSYDLAESTANKVKLNTLAQTAAVGTTGGPYVTAPLCRLTVGKWFVNELVAFSSLKYDIDLGDATWDIDGTGIPHVITVGLDFTVLGAKGIPINSDKIFIG